VLIRARKVADVVGRVVVADVLQRRGYGLNQVGLFDDGGHDAVLCKSIVVCAAVPELRSMVAGRHQSVAHGDSQRREQEGDVNQRLP
jgi:hypothetical protein